MNLGEIRAEVRIILQEPSIDFYTDAEINQWINFGLLDFCTLSELLKDTHTESSVASTADYDLPANFLKSSYVAFNNVKLYYTSPQRLNIIDDKWLNKDPGTPTKYMFYKHGKYSLWVAPDSIKTIFMYFIRKATPLAGDGAVPEINLEYHHALIDYACAKAKEKDNQLVQAQFYFSSFNNYVIHAKREGKRKEKYDFKPSMFPAVYR